MPVYNTEEYLREAIESILNQTFKNFEFLIIDDGSIDNSKNIILSYDDPRIRFISHEQNKKLIATLNEGIEMANAPLIARMDADDISLPDRLEKQVKFMNENPEYVLLGSACEIIDKYGKTTRKSSTFYDDETLRLSLALSTSFAHGSVMFRKKTALEAGGYSADAYLAEDCDFWMRLAKFGKIANLPEYLFKYRSNPAGECAKNKECQQEVLKKIKEEYWKSFGNQGPAPFKFWSKKWIMNNSGKNLYETMEKQIAYLHIRFAKKYIRYRKYIPAIFHLFCALILRPKEFMRGIISKGLYFFQDNK